MVQATAFQGVRAPGASRPPQVQRWTWTIRVAALVLGVSCSAGLIASDVPDIRVETLNAGTSGRDERKLALQSLPLQRLTPEQRQKANAVLQDVSLFRRLPKIRCESDPRMHGYFCDHPDVAVSIWRAMGVSGLKMTKTAPGKYTCDAGDGTVGDMEVLYRTPSSSLVVCTGTFTSPLLPKPIKGAGLMHLQVTTQKDSLGNSLVTQQADMFISFPSQAVDFVARTIAPVTNKIMDKNFEEVSLFLRMMDEASQVRPDWIYEVSGQLDGVKKEDAGKLVELTKSIHAAHAPQIGAQPATTSAVR